MHIELCKNIPHFFQNDSSELVDFTHPMNFVLECQRGIGCWAEDVFGLPDIRQRMCVGGGCGKARGARSGGRSRIVNLTDADQ